MKPTSYLWACVALLCLLCSVPAMAQTQVKNVGIRYFNGVPTTAPATATGGEVAIDTTTGYLYMWQRDAAAWSRVHLFDRLAGTSAPGYVPSDKQSIFVANDADSLYMYRSGAWRHLNKATTDSNWSNSSNTATGNYTQSGPNRVLTIRDYYALLQNAAVIVLRNSLTGTNGGVLNLDSTGYAVLSASSAEYGAASFEAYSKYDGVLRNEARITGDTVLLNSENPALQWNTTAGRFGLKAHPDADYTIVMPADAGADGQVLVTNGVDTARWEDASGGSNMANANLTLDAARNHNGNNNVWGIYDVSNAYFQDMLGGALNVGGGNINANCPGTVSLTPDVKLYVGTDNAEFKVKAFRLTESSPSTPAKLVFDLPASGGAKTHTVMASPWATATADTTYLPDQSCPVDGYVIRGRANSTTYWAQDDTSATNEIQTLSTSKSSNDVALSISSGNTAYINVADADSLPTNEGALSVGAATDSTANIATNTSGDGGVYLKEGRGIELTETADTITLTVPTYDRVLSVLAVSASTTLSTSGVTTSINGTASSVTVAATDIQTRRQRVRYTTTAATNQQAGIASSANIMSVQGGFTYESVFYFSTTSANARGFAGFSSNLGITIDPTTATNTNVAAFAFNDTDTNWFFVYNDGSGTAASFDLGVAKNTSGAVWKAEIWGDENSISYRLTNLATASAVSGKVTTNIPVTASLIRPGCLYGTGDGTTAVAIDFSHMIVKSAY